MFVISSVIFKVAAISRRQPKLGRARRVSLMLIFCVVFLFLFFVNSASAATYYVALDGSDAAAGTIDAPLATIEYAIETKASAGDTIILRAGTYGPGGNGVNIWKTGTDNKIGANKSMTVSAYTGESVTIDMPSTTDVYGIFQIGGTWLFSRINFTNSTSKTSYIISEKYDSQTDLTVQDSTIDNNNTVFTAISATSSVVNFNPSITFIRSKFKNFPATVSVVNNYLLAGRTLTFTSKSCLYRSTGRITTFVSNRGNMNVTFINNTVANLKDNLAFYQVSGDIMVIENNIFRADATFTAPLTVNGSSKENWTINNNIVYRATATDPGDSVSNLMQISNTGIYTPNTSNYYLDPYFTNEAGDDYTLGSATYISGRGKVASLPTDGDINGNAWIGADIGAYANPSATAQFPTIVPNTVAFLGDSIAEGLGIQANTDGWLSPLTVVGSGNLGAAIGGSGGPGVKWYVDRAAVTWMPQYVVIFSWHNNFVGASTVSPTNLTYQQAADDTMIAVAKARYWGMTPIVIGMVGASAVTFSGQTVRPLAFNTTMETTSMANGVSFASPLDRMLFNPNFANVYTSAGTEGYYQTGGLTANVHPAAVGYQLIESVVEDITKSRTGYYVTQSGTSVVASQYGPGTYRYPISIAGLNNQYAHGSYVDLPYGVTGKTIYATGNFSTQLVAPAPGASGAPFTLTGGIWQAGVQITQPYWINLDSDKDITAFSFAGLTPAVIATINGTAITATVPYGTSVTALVATFTTTGNSVAVDATTQTNGTTPNDFTNPATYTITAADNSTQNYTVTVTVALNPAKAITAFSFASPSAIGTIAGTDITIAVPCGTDKTALTPTITIIGSSVSPASGTAGNFTTPQTYTVTAEDGTTQTYTVSAASTNCGGGSSFMLLFTTTQPTPTPTPTPIITPAPQYTMTPEQRLSAIAQIKQQLISLITQVIQLLYLQISQMAR